MTFAQFKKRFGELKKRFPLAPNRNYQVENAGLGNWLLDCKNAYYSFDTSRSKDIIYIFDSYKAIECMDGDYVIESELCYECIDVYKVYKCIYLNYCSRMYDSAFCWDCSDSNNLFGCVHLFHKEYCIFNMQYKKDEYQTKVKELLKRPAEENLKEMSKLGYKFPVTTTNVGHSENCDYGNHIHYSKNLYMCFDAAHSEDCAYLYDSHHNKNCYDLEQSFHCQDCYECIQTDNLNNCFYITNSTRLYDSGFCDKCADGNHLFGCVELAKKEYCILNKQYSKDQYEKEINEIMESFRSRS